MLKDTSSQYSTEQLVGILCECFRNVATGSRLMEEANFDHAALSFEVAASKLRTLAAELPSKAAIENTLKSENVCSSCGDAIRYNGQYWIHLNSNPRHPAIPK